LADFIERKSEKYTTKDIHIQIRLPNTMKINSGDISIQLKIIVFEDEPVLLSMWGKLLQNAGFEVNLNDSTASLKSIYELLEYDLIITDNHMKVWNEGLKLLKEMDLAGIKKDVLFVTSCAYEDEVRLFAGSNENIFLFSKPLDINEILAFIKDRNSINSDDIHYLDHLGQTASSFKKTTPEMILKKLCAAFLFPDSLRAT